MRFQPLSSFTFVLACAPLLCSPVQAQAVMDHSAMGHAAPVAAAKGAAAMADGEVKKIDTTAQTITLAHGPIMNLGMPAMTMAFKVKTPAMLGMVKVGDKVKFSAEMPNGVMTVVALEARR
jgi:Cu/Ag efflux protein CusF